MYFHKYMQVAEKHVNLYAFKEGNSSNSSILQLSFLSNNTCETLFDEDHRSGSLMFMGCTSGYMDVQQSLFHPLFMVLGLFAITGTFQEHSGPHKDIAVLYVLTKESQRLA